MFLHQVRAQATEEQRVVALQWRASRSLAQARLRAMRPLRILSCREVDDCRQKEEVGAEQEGAKFETKTREFFQIFQKQLKTRAQKSSYRKIISASHTKIETGFSVHNPLAFKNLKE